MADCFLSTVSKEKIDKALTPERVSAIWRYAKAQYIDRGVSFEQTLTGMAHDLGLPREIIARAFTKPKALRNVTDEVYRKQQARYNTVRAAGNHVATIDSPAAYKLVVALTSIPRRVLTFGHGPVFPVTHALDLAGSEFATYAKTVKQSWQFAGKASHAAAMDNLRNNGLYQTARRAGLEIDPERGPQGILSGGSGGWARRSWDALKVARMSLFEERWNNIPEAERTREMGKLLASQINHSTGVMSSGEWGFGAVSKGMFAPQLTASKIAKTVVDPAMTAATYYKVATGMEISFAERYAASLRTKKAASALAKYIGLLAVNQGFLSASGSDEKINFLHPSQTDWLRPKFAGHTLNTRGSLEIIRLVGSLAAISQSTRGDLHGSSRTEAARDAAAKYAQYKAAPMVQLGAELTLSEDTFGRPVPWSDQSGSQNRPKYTVPEYVLSKSPIYLGGATREIYDAFREEGISASDATSLIRALMNNPEIVAKGVAVGVGEFVGGGIGKSPSQQGGGTGSQKPMKPAF